ncbi:uncharacterized protein M437DRAFT_69881 [Aureobasidium melanogenum CBS 110374]|uniref:Uncharacterized protein n=1 Tax=Aureobasidium melanogenum (strain CBS 110374) TaxID=1043003 RepID=A0A074VCV8_AURM1|nr:uncharacterized protein M437DRAFT_69881 [Aureobasidium melanogenum CBS 110374]KEQ58535.1 hypothetical protein M437DRAFT_69881 [Aureobasidium melanogenum CBS 110374]
MWKKRTVPFHRQATIQEQKWKIGDQFSPVTLEPTLRKTSRDLLFDQQTFKGWFSSCPSQMLDARRFENDRTPNDPSACVERLRKDAPTTRESHCNIVRASKDQRDRQDHAKHPAADTKQHTAALVVDFSVVKFELDPRVLLVEDEMR